MKLNDNEDMFEPETIECKPNIEGLFNVAVTIIRTNIAKDQGREFVLEMMELGMKAYLRASGGFDAINAPCQNKMEER